MITSPADGSKFEAHLDGTEFTVSIFLTSTVSDPDGGPLSVVWTWPGGSTTGIEGSTGGLTVGSYTITATVTDSSGATATDTVSIVVWIPSD